jgi:hypothetical protein
MSPVFRGVAVSRCRLRLTLNASPNLFLKSLEITPVPDPLVPTPDRSPCLNEIYGTSEGLSDPQGKRVRCKSEGKADATTNFGGADGFREV